MAKRRTAGVGSICKRNDGRWVGTYTDPITKKRQYVYGKTQKEVKSKIKELLENQTKERQWEKEEQKPTKREKYERQYEREQEGIELVSVQKEKSKNLAVEKSGKIGKAGKDEGSGLPETKQQTLAEWVKYYLYAYKKAELKASTFSNYLWKFATYVEPFPIAKMPLREITTNDLQGFYNDKTEKGYNSKTVRHIKILINGALEQAVRMGLIRDNPNRYTILPKKKQFESRTLNKEEVAKILAEGKEEWVYPLVVVCMTCGLRKGELLGLRWKNIDWEKKVIYVTGSLCRIAMEPDGGGRKMALYEILEPKTQSSIRTIPMMRATYEALCMQKERQDKDKEQYGEIYQDSDLVFARMDGRYINPRVVNEKFFNLLEQFGIPPVRFHDLRHTYATLLMESGVAANIVQKLLGHSSVMTTLDIYTHVSEELKLEAIQGADIIFHE